MFPILESFTIFSLHNLIDVCVYVFSFWVELLFCVHNLSQNAVASAPTNFMVAQEDPTGVHMSWTPPTPLGYTTGYRIHYNGGSSDSVNVSGGSIDKYLLTGLHNGASYTMSIVGTSEHIFSEEVTMDISLCEYCHGIIQDSFH